MFAGTGEKGERDGMAFESQFDCPEGIIFEERGNICYVCDSFNHKIRMIHYN